MKRALLVATLLALAPAGAIAGNLVLADARPTVSLDSTFASQFSTNVVVDRFWRSCRRCVW